VLGGALFFLPVLPRLLERYADAAELAAVLLTFDTWGAGVHPDRVDRLLGERVDARIPVPAILTAAAMIVALLALGLAGASLNGHDYPLVITPAAIVVTAVVAAILRSSTDLRGSLVGWRRGRRLP
jgi:hypothetical protein